jgi:hypothetical protein
MRSLTKSVAVVVVLTLIIGAISLTHAAILPNDLGQLAGIATVSVASGVLVDPSLNAAAAARFWGVSITSLNRDIREQRHPPADFLNGPYRYWKLSTLVRTRELRIAEGAAAVAAMRQKQQDAAARARVELKRKRAATAATPPDTA